MIDTFDKWLQSPPCPICQERRADLTGSLRNISGIPNLDWRPIYPRSPGFFYVYFVRCCTGCGYCAYWEVHYFAHGAMLGFLEQIRQPTSRLRGGLENARRVLASDRYRKQLANTSLSDGANWCLCSAMLSTADGRPARAVMATIFAAWQCDEEDHPAAAAACRLEAVGQIERFWAKGRTWMARPGVDEAVAADLLRRAAQFKHVAPVCEAGLRKPIQRVDIRQALLFQMALALQRDAKGYEMTDARQFAGESDE